MNEKQIVFKLSELESELDRKKWDLKLEEEKYEKNKPVQPMRQIAQKIPYPEIVSRIKYNYVLGIIVPIIIMIAYIYQESINIKIIYRIISSYYTPAVAVTIFFFFIIYYSVRKKKDLETQRNSKEYIEKCRGIDIMNADYQIKLDAEYNQVLAK